VHDAVSTAVAQRTLRTTARARAVLGVRRRPSPYRSSHPLEELTVELAGGEELRVAFKRLGCAPARPGGPVAPRFVLDLRREPAVYESLLGCAPPGAPQLIGSTSSPAGERWLLVEWVGDARELYQAGDLATWEAAARWLGSFHVQMAPGLGRHAANGRLLGYDAAYYRVWLQRALGFAREHGRTSRAARFLGGLAQRHDAVVDTLLGLPQTVVHGDFNAANVLVGGGREGLRVAPVDWELAAAGPGLVDLATLVSGAWSAAERECLTAAYAGVPGVPAFSRRELSCARLHVALRWLGWAAPGWTPPPLQRHDWLDDAIALAQELWL
jgi:hypothetical protein